MATVTADQLGTSINIRAHHGDNWQQEYRFLASPGGPPINLTGKTFASHARGTTGQLTPLTVTVPDPSNGTIYLQPPAAGALPVDLHDYDIQVTEAGGAKQTWIRGRIRIQQDVTP